MHYDEGMSQTLPTNGPAIRRARLCAGYGVTEFATKVGITYSHMSRIESGKAKASPTLVRHIAETLGRKVNEFVDPAFLEAA